MKKVFIFGFVFLCGCAAKKKVTATMPIPTCGASIIVPKGCDARQWGNGVEVDCPGQAKIYICQPLKQPSPR